MKHITFYTKTRWAHAHIIGLKGSISETLVVSVHSNKKQLKLYELPLCLQDEVSKIKSYTALVAFAKANHIIEVLSDIKRLDAQLAPCPVPAKLQGKPSPRSTNDVSTANANANVSASDVDRGIFSFTDILHITQHELANTPDTKALLAIKQQNETIYQHCLDTGNIKSGDQDFMQAVAKQIDALTVNIARASHICPYCPDWFGEPIRNNGGVFASCCGCFLAYEELSA